MTGYFLCLTLYLGKKGQTLGLCELTCCHRPSRAARILTVLGFGPRRVWKVVWCHWLTDPCWKAGGIISWMNSGCFSSEMVELESLIFIEHFSWWFFQLFLKFLCIVFLREWGVSGFLIKQPLLGDLPVSLGLNGGCVPPYRLLSLHWTRSSLCSPRPLGIPHWLLTVCCLELEAQQVGDCAASSFWTSGKGREQWRPSFLCDLQSWLGCFWDVLFTALHC